MKQLLLLIFIWTLAMGAKSQQTITQTVRGTVIDMQTLTPLPGANVILLNSDPIIGVSADENGRFRLENIPVGRIGIRVTFLGYKDVFMTSLDLLAGKELVLKIEMEEVAIMSEEVVITAKSEKDNPINDMASVSARSFTVEETERFAGSRNDVSRMASNYAGVRGTDDSRNDIIIRGNSPSGLLWRLEGVDIPNPNHYGSTESTGGPVSILNNNQLANSDFMTGAFPAEYGNAISGVFDLKMRNGNDEKHEFLGQIGFNGFEFGAEGPISREKGSSYLANYRYSTLEAFNAIGVDFGTGTAIPKYQDGSFKINLPQTKLGSFTVFGMGGKSDISFLNSEKDTLEESVDFYAGEGFDLINGSDMAVLGFSNTYLINKNTYSKLVIAGTYHDFHVTIDSINPENYEILPYFRNSHKEYKFFANYFLNYRINSQNSIKVGFTYSHSKYDFIDSAYIDEHDRFDIITQFEGTTSLLQPYVEWQYKINNELTLNTGLHYQHFFYNNTNSIEPRAGLKWNFTPGQTLSFGYGYHSQLAPITVYFDQTRLPDGTYFKPNKDLNMTHSQHFVVGYDRSLGDNMRLKTEAYYQYITNAGVDGHEKNSFSLLNQGANFGIFNPDTLINEGTGRNYGLEITLERFLSNGMYFLVTTSFYDSKYKGSDGKLHNTAFNGNYVANGLIGKEWSLSRDPEKRKKKQYKLLVDIKTTFAGGQRYTPIEAIQVGENQYVAEYDNENAFSKQFDDYFRTDLRIALKQNNKKVTMEFALDIQNLFNTQNIYNQSFNSRTGEIDYNYQLGMLVIPQFRINF
ncbi:MAG TPA: TonB-dependent receptor [Bacteroidales bacterium]|nr:TonB-dependent receptor [Bacteroidales bacterium]